MTSNGNLYFESLEFINAIKCKFLKKSKIFFYFVGFFKVKSSTKTLIYETVDFKSSIGFIN